MHLSLRSQMIAGIAALSATAVAVTPITQSVQLPSPHVSSAVQLSSFVSPIGVISSTLELAAFYGFSTIPVPPGGPTQDFPDPADWLYWPDSFYGADYLYAPGYWGAVPDQANQISFGALSAVVNNWSTYAEAGLSTLGLVQGVGDALWNTPQAVITAVGYLASGDTASAIATLQTQILAPIQSGVAAALNGVGWIIDNVIANVRTLATYTLPSLVANLGSAVVGGAAAVVNTLVTTATQVVADLAGLNVEAAWNDAVTGLLGPDGTLGTISQLTLGIGLIEDVSYDDGQGGTIVVPTVVVPSIRSVLTSTGQRLGSFSGLGDGGIGNDYWTGSWTPTPAAARSTKRAAAAAATVAPLEGEADDAATAASPPKQAGGASGAATSAKAATGKAAKAAKAAGRAAAAAR